MYARDRIDASSSASLGIGAWALNIPKWSLAIPADVCSFAFSILASGILWRCNDVVGMVMFKMLPGYIDLQGGSGHRDLWW